jgi:hypothetical protein
MTRLVARSLLLVSAVAAGCGSARNGQTDVTGPAGNGSVTVEGPGTGECTSGAVTSGPSRPVFAPGGGIAGTSNFSPQVGVTHTAAVAPPAISGGTLTILDDGHTAVVADPDRDQIYVVDVNARSVTSTIALNPGDEPGRLVADAAGRVHVALRRGGALVTISPTSGTIIARRAVCAAPRGVAYDSVTDLLHVACADGQLVTLPAAGGAAVRTLQLDGDLRDVIVDGGQLRVSRFRSAELLTVEANGTMSKRVSPPGFRSVDTRGGQIYTASTVWRAMAMPTGGVVMLHQRGLLDPVQPTAGGYGGVGPCDAIVQTAVTTVAPGQDLPQTGPAMAGMVLPVDMALSSDGAKIAIIAAGNATNSESAGGPARLPRLFVTDMTSATDPVVGCQSDGQHGPCLPLNLGGPVMDNSGTVCGSDICSSSGAPVDGGSSPDPTAADAGVPSVPVPTPAFPDSCAGMAISTAAASTSVPDVSGQPIAVAFAGDTRVVVQTREPAQLEVPGGPPIVLSTTSRSDTGHDLFHANAGGFIACASCHAEGTEDGRTWNFACEGARRTQSLQVGLKGTEPFHWDGDEKDFPQLVNDVFVGRMSGPQMTSDQTSATLTWIDAQPRRTRTPPTDLPAVARGQALFQDPQRAACSTCHNGPSLTNNQTLDVGTGGKFQVPSLVGIGTRGPFMHDGCAATLRDRFGACGGGDKHGVTSRLQASQVDDLLAYLNTL